MNPPSSTPEAALKNAGGTAEVILLKSPDIMPGDKEPTPPTKAQKALSFFTFADVQPTLSANDFVEGLLVTGAMSVIYGESNCGKTFLALDLALHVAHGKPWFDTAVVQGPVLFLALEGGNGFRNRVVAFRATHGVSDRVIPFAGVTQSLNLLDPDGDLEAIIETANAVREKFGALPVLIVIDTLSRAMPGGNENAPEDMTALVRAGDRLRAATGSHCLWVHHSGKDQARGARGHSSLRAATDTEIEVISDNGARRAEVKKQRDLEGGGIISFELHSVEVAINDRGKPVTSCVVVTSANGDNMPGEPARNLKGNTKRAYEVLIDTIASEGKIIHAEVPDGIASVAEGIWRDRFYTSAMAGDAQDTKQKAFRRASNELLNKHIVAMKGGRVWLTTRNQPEQEDQT